MVNKILCKKAITQMLTLWAVLLLQMFFFSANAAIQQSKENQTYAHNGEKHWVSVPDLATTAANQYFVVYTKGLQNINFDKLKWGGVEHNMNEAVQSVNVNWKDGTAVAGTDSNADDTYLIYQIPNSGTGGFEVYFRSWSKPGYESNAVISYYIMDNIYDLEPGFVIIDGPSTVTPGNSATFTSSFTGGELDHVSYTWKWETSQDRVHWTAAASTTNSYTTDALSDGEFMYVRAFIQGPNPLDYGLNQKNFMAMTSVKAVAVVSTCSGALVKVAGPYYIQNYYTDNNEKKREYLVDDNSTYLKGAKNPTLGTEHQWNLWKNATEDYYYLENVSTGNFVDVMDHFGDEGSFSNGGDFDRMSMSALECEKESEYRFKLSDLPYTNVGAIVKEKVMISEYGNSANPNRPLTDTWDMKQDEYKNNDPVYIYSTNRGEGDVRYWNFTPVENPTAGLTISANPEFVAPGKKVVVTAKASSDVTYYYSIDDGVNWIEVTDMTYGATISGEHNSQLEMTLYGPTQFIAMAGDASSNELLVESSPVDACDGQLVALFYEPFKLNSTGDLSCYQQQYEGMNAYNYANGDCIKNGYYAVINNGGNGCHGKDACVGGSDPNRTWFINDFDHTGDKNSNGNYVGGMLAINFSRDSEGDILTKQYELPIGAKLVASFYVAALTRENGNDPANLTLFIEESDDNNNWSEVTKVDHNLSMTHKSYLDWQEVRASITTTKKYARVRIRGNNSGDNGSDIVFDDITIMACQPQIEWKLDNKPLTDDESNVMIACNKSQWVDAFQTGIPWIYTTEIQNNTTGAKSFVASYFITGTADDYEAGVAPFDKGTYDKANSTYNGLPLIYLGNGLDCNEQNYIHVPINVGQNVVDIEGNLFSGTLFESGTVYTITNYLFPSEDAAQKVKDGADQTNLIFAKSVPMLYTPPLVVTTNVCELTTNKYNEAAQGDLVNAFTNTWSVAGYEKVEVYNEGDIAEDDLVPVEGKKPIVTITEEGVALTADSSFYMNTEGGELLYSKQYQVLHYKKNDSEELVPYEKTLYRLNVVDMPEIETMGGSDWKIETTNVTGCITKTEVTGGGTFTAHYSVKDGGTLAYTWTATKNGSAFDISSATKDGASLTVSNLDAGTYVFNMSVKNTKVDSCDCSKEESTTLIVYPKPDEIITTATVPSVEATAGTYCLPGDGPYTVNLEASATTADGASVPTDFSWQYKWTALDGGTITSLDARTATNTATVPQAGTYQFQVEVYGKAGDAVNETCTATDIVTVEIHEIPKANGATAFSYEQTCVDKTKQTATVKITAPDLESLQEDGAYLYYEWNVAGKTASGKDLKEFTTNEIAAGNYNGTLNVYSAKDDGTGGVKKSNCFVTLNMSFTVYAVPSSITVSATADETCLADDTKTATITLDATVAGTLGTDQTWTYAWTCTEGTGAVIADATAKQTTATVGAGSYKFKLAVKAAGSDCTEVTDENDDPIIISVKPTVSITPNITVLDCVNNSATLSTTPSANVKSYSWTGGSTGNSLTVSSAGTYTVTVYSDDAKTCSNSASQTITADTNMPTVNITMDPNTSVIDCNNPEIALKANIDKKGGTIQNIEWSNGASGVAKDTIHVSDAGTYKVTVSLTNGCSADATQIISKNVEKPVITVTAPAAVCAPLTIDVATSTLSGANTYNFYSDADCLNEMTNTVVNATTTYYVKGTKTANGCVSDAVSATATINPKPEIPTIPLFNVDASQDYYYKNVACNGGNTGSVTFAAKDIIGGTFTDATLTWYKSDFSGTVDASALTAGIYKLIVTSAASCKDTTEVTIAQPDAIVISTINKFAETTPAMKSYYKEPLCKDDANGILVVDDSSISGGTAPYTKSLTDVAGATVEDWTKLAAGTYILTVTDANNCSETQTITIGEPDKLQLPEIVAYETGTPTTNYYKKALCNGDATGSLVIDEATISGGVKPAAGYILTLENASGAPIAKENWTTLAAGSYTLTVKDANNCADTKEFTIEEPTAIVISAISKFAATTPAMKSYYKEPLCKGDANGELVVDDSAISGGTAPYTKSLTNASSVEVSDWTKLAAGTYTLTVTDANNCSETQEIIIGEPDAIVLPEITKDVDGTSTTNYFKDADCNSSSTGKLVVDVNSITGGTQFTTGDKYKMELKSKTTGTQITNWEQLKADTYTLTVTDANDCFASKDITIGEPTAISVSTIGKFVDGSGMTSYYKEPLCKGDANGELVVDDSAISGGTAPYTKSLTNASSVEVSDWTKLAAGTYTLTVTDAKGCLKTQDITIGEPDKLTIEAAVEYLNKTATNHFVYHNETCNDANDGYITISKEAITGGTLTTSADFSYVWTKGGVVVPDVTKNLVAGTYNLVVTDDNNCSATAEVEITEPVVVEKPTMKTEGVTIKHDDTTGKDYYELCAKTSGTEALNDFVANKNNADTLVWFQSGVEYTTATINTASVTEYAMQVVGKKKNDYGTYCASDTVDVYFKVVLCPDFNVEITANPSETCQTAGDDVVTFTVKITNNASAAVSDVVANVAISSEYTDIENAGVAFDGTWSVGTINAGADATLTLTGKPTGAGKDLVSKAYITSYSDGAATISYASYDVADATVKDDVTSTINAKPQFTLALAEGNTGCIGETDAVKLTSTITNGVVPATYKWEVISDNNADVTFTTDNAANAVATINATEEKEYVFQLTVTTEDGCTNVNTLPVTSVNCTDLTMEVTQDKDAICENDTVTYTVKVTNNASVAATGIKVAYKLPANLKPIEGTPEKLDVADIAAGANSTTTLKAVGMESGADLEVTFSVAQVNGAEYTAEDADAKGWADTIQTTVNALPEKLNIDAAGLSNLKYCINDPVKDLNEVEADENCTLEWSADNTNWSANVPTISSTPPARTTTIYVRQVSDKGCIGLPENFAYIVNDNPTITIDNVIQIKCAVGQGATDSAEKGSIEATVNGAATIEYAWKKGDNIVAATEDLTDVDAGTYTLYVTDGNGCKASESATINAAPEAMEIEATDFTPLVCGGMSDGKIITAVSGGTPAYSYNWTKDGVQISTEPNLFDLGGGEYMLTVTDNNSCTADGLFAINQPEKIVINENVHIDVQCFGQTGTIALSIEGGEPDYTYQWSNGVTSSLAENLTKGDYTVTVTDAYNCKADTTITIKGPDADLIATLISKTDVKCYGESSGAAEVSVNGGTPDYTFEWSRGAGTDKNLSNAAAGYYELTVTDANGCQKLLPVNIETPEEIRIGVYNGKMLICKNANDGYVSSSVYGGVPPYNYEWSTGSTESDIKDLVVGTYTLKITDNNGCVKSHDYEIEGQEPMVDLQISLETNDEDNRILPGDEVTFTANAVHDQRIEEVYYNWNYNGWTAGQDTYQESIYKDKVIDLWVSDGVCPDQQIKLPVQVIWPTIFTPYDNNGVNDEFLSPKAEGKAHRADWYIIVFNRYGQKVYEGKCGWDGTYKGKTADPGAYYYTVKFPNGETHDGAVEVSKQD